MRNILDRKLKFQDVIKLESKFLLIRLTCYLLTLLRGRNQKTDLSTLTNLYLMKIKIV